jgi:hypothetical protein
MGVVIGWNADVVIRRCVCQRKCKWKLTHCWQHTKSELAPCSVESESYASELLGIQGVASARVVGTAGGSRMGFQGGCRFVPEGGSFAAGVVVGGPRRSPVSGYQWDEQEDGQQVRRVSPDAHRQDYPK